MIVCHSRFPAGSQLVVVPVSVRSPMVRSSSQLDDDNFSRKGQGPTSDSGLSQIMFVVYLTIPFMLFGIAIAVVPLLWAMWHRHQWEECSEIPSAESDDEAVSPIAA